MHYKHIEWQVHCSSTNQIQMLRELERVSQVVLAVYEKQLNY